MSVKVTLKKTPLPIRVGNQVLKFVTFEDVYNECLKDRQYFNDLMNKALPLETVLLRKKHVLAEKCFQTLLTYRGNAKYIKCATTLIESNAAWPTPGQLREPCHWNDCPERE
jgi:hypothetical protein